MSEFSTTWRVQYYETDKMGIVHHSNYIRYFETARTEYIRECGLAYDDMEKAGIWMPVLNVNVQFKTPAVYDEIIRIRCRTAKVRGASVDLQYEISNYETGEVHVTGSSSHGFTTPELKPIKIKRDAPEIYRIFEKAKEECDE
ncbi:MAG: thioesterase family protein [Bacillota bacterium]|nr:thioesterase family protein [Bacillota bacterium]